MAVKAILQLRMGPRVPETEALALELCALVFRRGKIDGRYAIAMNELQEAVAIDRPDLQSALQFAFERTWLEPVGAKRTISSLAGWPLYVVLKAAGIHVAKEVLDRPP